jgi:altronate dehydratase
VAEDNTPAYNRPRLGLRLASNEEQKQKMAQWIDITLSTIAKKNPLPPSG